MSMVDEFCEQHFALNGISEDRQRRQRNALLAFEDYCSPTTLQEAGPEMVESWMVFLLKKKRLQPNTVRWYLGMVRPFYEWLYKKGEITRERLLVIQDVKKPAGSKAQNEPNPYDRKEILQFWADLDKHRPYALAYVRRWRRDQSRWKRVWRHAERLQIEAITTLALYCGLRQMEIRTVSLDDIDPLNEYIPVVGKGGKVRKVPFPESARNRVEAWLDFRREINPSHDYPWLTLGRYEVHHTNALPERSLATMFSKVGSGYRLHRFRHTCATEWLRAGVPIEKLAKILGHANVGQTLAYAKIVPDDARDSMNRYERIFRRAIEPKFEPESTNDSQEDYAEPA